MPKHGHHKKKKRQKKPVPRTKRAKRKVHKVMHEFKEGTLRSSSGSKVVDRKQALAIALSEARRQQRRRRRRRS